MNKSTNAFLRASMAGGILFAGYISSATAADVSVCPSGCAHTTISAGLFAANPGDRVVVGTPGRVVTEVYNENILMQDGVDLVSEGGNSTTTYVDTLGATGYSTTVLRRTTLTVIRGSGSGAVVMFPAISTLYPDTLLDGFIIENIDAGAEDWTGLILIGGQSPTIQNNIVRDNRGPARNGGITMIGTGTTAATPLIQNNVIHYMNGPGVGARSNTNPTILNNVIFTTPPDTPDFSPGIGLADDATATIRGNTIFSNGRGGIGSVEFGVSDTGIPIVITGNTIYNHMPWGGVRITGKAGSSGVQIQIGGPNPADSNEFYGNMGGVRLDHQDSNGRMASALIQNNNFHNNAAGVRGENMTLLTIIDNTMNDQVTFCAVRAHNSDTIVIEDNEMHNNFLCGIRIWPDNSAPNVSIRNNNISNSGFGGMRLDNPNMTGIVSGNRIYQNSRGGILILAPMVMEISDNEINNNIRGGIHTGLDLDDGLGFFGTNGSAVLTIRGNKVHHNGQGPLGGGIDVRHASGVIENNLVYKNHMGGIRYGDWMGSINNNTVVDNGQSGQGAGIAFDELTGPVNQAPPQGSPTTPISIQNNVLVGNANAGINAGTLYPDPPPSLMCGDHDGFRQYNLLSANNGQPSNCNPFEFWCLRLQLGTCNGNTGETFFAPQFVDAANENYRLAGGSPAVDAGNPSFPDDVSTPPGVGAPDIDMGAYGGANGMTW